MEYSNLQQQAASLKKNLFDQVYVGILVQSIVCFLFVQVLQYTYQYTVYHMNYSLRRLCNSTHQSFLCIITLYYFLFSI
jgi:hypothetical protein